MKIDVSISPDSMNDIARISEKAEGDAFNAMWFSVTSHDPFLQLALAAEHTKKIRIGTAIVLAFTRSPTVLVQTAWDLQRLSKGRMLLGLGSQVRGHIQRRFSEERLPPVARMRGDIAASDNLDELAERETARLSWEILHREPDERAILAGADRSPGHTDLLGRGESEDVLTGW
jgi:Luciferase-like monooxygenase